MTISVGVEMTSYLFPLGVRAYMKDKAEDVQLNDVRMSERPHVLNFSLDPRPRLRRMNDLLRYELHRDLVSCDGVYCHYINV